MAQMRGETVSIGEHFQSSVHGRRGLRTGWREKNANLPSDQISTLAPYSFCFTTSGAIQYGVPTMVARLDFWSVSLAEKPKSAGD